MGELVVRLSRSQPGVSKHLRVLREAGLVESRTDGQHRLYRVRTEPLEELDEWLSSYRELWTTRLDRLEGHLAKQAAQVSDGELLTGGARPAVRVERMLDDPPSTVWSALTDREELAAWFPCDVVVEGGEWRRGAALTFVFPPSVIDMTLTGEVLEVDEPNVLAYTWGDESLRFELDCRGHRDPAGRHQRARAGRCGPQCRRLGAVPRPPCGSGAGGGDVATSVRCLCRKVRARAGRGPGGAARGSQGGLSHGEPGIPDPAGEHS